MLQETHLPTSHTLQNHTPHEEEESTLQAQQLQNSCWAYEPVSCQPAIWFSATWTYCTKIWLYHYDGQLTAAAINSCPHIGKCTALCHIVQVCCYCSVYVYMVSLYQRTSFLRQWAGALKECYIQMTHMCVHNVWAMMFRSVMYMIRVNEWTSQGYNL